MHRRVETQVRFRQGGFRLEQSVLEMDESDRGRQAPPRAPGSLTHDHLGLPLDKQIQLADKGPRAGIRGDEHDTAPGELGLHFLRYHARSPGTPHDRLDVAVDLFVEQGGELVQDLIGSAIISLPRIARMRRYRREQKDQLDVRLDGLRQRQGTNDFGVEDPNERVELHVIDKPVFDHPRTVDDRIETAEPGVDVVDDLTDTRGIAHVRLYVQDACASLL